MRDPWEDVPGSGLDPDPGARTGTGPGATSASGHTHDPHEVTVQLDAVQLGDGLLRRAESTPRTGPAHSDGPVFVDSSGRRSRRFRRLGIAVGAACAVYAVVMAATLMSGNSDAPWLPVPGQEEGKPAGQVDTTPLPRDSTEPTAPTGGTAGPQSTPSPGDATTPAAPGAEPPAAGTTADPEPPGTTADPEPTAARNSPAPGGGGEAEPDPGQSSQEPDPGPADPTPTGDGTSPGPSQSTPAGGGASGGDDGTGGGDAGVAADGAQAPAPLAAGPDTPVTHTGARTSPSPSPEYTL
ncbi:hypothetical protein [Streptomyces poriticola]|uniref:hypothetical protein n=1 Tax=Streptomyces poriticola TaxID=3120506 RepID=UPI002FCE261B